MSINLFKKPHTIRSFAPQAVARGYASTRYEDVPALLDVQPLSADELNALPEGARTIKRVKAYGPKRLTAADENTGIAGDQLYYDGLWYECVSCVMWCHTFLGHYKSEFTLCADQLPPPLGVKR